MGFRDSDTIIEPIDDGGAFDSGEGSTSSTSESAANALAAANSAAAALVSENNAAADVVLTNADVVLTHADVILTNADLALTNADVVLTNADVVLAEADKVQTGLDRAAVAADLVLTNQDTIDTAANLALTNADVVLTHADVVLTHADVVLAEADKVQTGLDRIATNADVVLTNADVVLTNADVVLAEADKVQTGLDRIATNADVVSTNADVALTNADVLLTDADRVQTGLDRVATAADVVSTNADVVLTNADVVSAGNSVTAAALSATASATAKTAAETAKTAAETAKTAAETAETNAETAETNAETAETNAAGSATASSNSATSAATSASTATTKAGEAATSATNAAASETAAQTAETNAETAETNAAASASTATTKASEASTSATNAATSATSAATSATAAQTAETNAETAETNAAASSTSASSSASTATTKAGEAATSATSASGSASTATTKASEAATSATSASGSATTATTKASEASASATNAATSATSASSSASTATTKASEAATSATNAATSASTATTKASEASTSATSAATSASNSASSATAAQTAETNAETAETNAAASATTSSTKADESLTSANSSAASATAATAAKDAALAALDSFDDRYLGDKASDPTVDNDGNALVSGALYFNTTDDIMKVYTGSAWVAAYASLSGALLATNNLSDLDNAVSARSNLGLVIGTNVQAFSAILAATTASYTTALNTKLSGIETGATADQTGSEIKTAYEAQANAFTDAQFTKLSGIETGATADQTNAEIRAAVEAATDSNVFTDADHTKLNGIAAGATNVTNNNQLTNGAGYTTNVGDITGVTAGSGISGGGTSGTVTINHAATSTQASLTALTGAAVVSDIDLDGFGHVTGLATRNMTLANLGYTGETNATADQTAAQLLTAIKTVDGSGSGLDADLLDGQHASAFLTAEADTLATVTGRGATTTATVSVNTNNTAANGFSVGETFTAQGGWHGQMILHGTGHARSTVKTGNVLMGTYAHDGWHNISGSTQNGHLGTYTNHGVGFITNAVLRMALNTSGNLGINVSAPTEKLDVGGNIKASGTLTIAGASTFSGNVQISASDTLVVGGTLGNNAYNSVSSSTIYLGGGNDRNNYSIGTLMENTGGNYTKLDLRWHTGIRMFAMPQYGGMRYFTDNSMSTEIFSIGKSDSHVRVANNLIIGGTVDGRDVSTDGTKLDTIATNANNYSFPYTVSASASNSTVVQRHPSGYIFANYFNTTANDVSSGVTKVMVETGNDNYIRHGSAGAIRSFINVADGANNYSLPATPSVTGINIGSQVNLAESTDRADLLQITSSTSGWAGLQIRNSSNEGRWSFMTDGGNAGFYDDENGGWAMQMDENGGVRLYYGASTVRLNTVSTGVDISGTLYVDGNITHNGDTDTYIGFSNDVFRVTTGGTQRLEVNNSAVTAAVDLRSTANVIAYYSDERLKTRVGDIENAVEKVKTLDAFYYVENDLAKTFGYDSDKKQVALSAQDVQKVLPEAVTLAPFDMEDDHETGETYSKSGENYLTVDYAKMVPLLIQAIKEQQQQIDTLKEEVSELRGK